MLPFMFLMFPVMAIYDWTNPYEPDQEILEKYTAKKTILVGAHYNNSNGRVTKSRSYVFKPNNDSGSTRVISIIRQPDGTIKEHVSVGAWWIVFVWLFAGVMTYIVWKPSENYDDSKKSLV